MKGSGGNSRFDIMPLPKISVIILVGGTPDKALLKKCLESVDWADEVVKIETDNLKGSFADWRNLGAEKAHAEWLLYVDTDEAVTLKLKEEIFTAVGSNKFAGWAIPRRNIFLGHKMRWGGWYPDYVLRLIRKDKLKDWVGNLHEQPKVDGAIGHLKESLIHESHRNLTDMVEKTNKWSEIEAELLYKSGHPQMNFFRFCSAGFREAWYRGIVKLGFLDGTVGVIEIIYQTFSRLITYSKLWEKQLKNARSNN